MKEGILILNKPQNWTSHDCVAVCRRVTGIRKTGHGGTLDPMAEGLLSVFLGKAAKIIEYLDADYKTYRCTASLGMVTDTQDIWGTVIERKSITGITERDIEKAVSNFKGEIIQTPPIYSAVRVNGKRLYEYARRGQEVDIKPRKVRIRNIDIIETDISSGTVSFDVTCSKGTYIRSICSDLGKMLGCGGVMTSLTRTASGIFTLEKAVSPDELKEMSLKEVENLLIRVDKPLGNLGKIQIQPDRARYFRSGNSIRWDHTKILKKPAENSEGRYNSRGRSYDSLYTVYEAGSGIFLGIGYHSATDNMLKADKILV